MQPVLLISAAKILLSLIFLAYASWSDYKTREVSNRVWLLYAPMAFALTFTELFLSDFSMLPFYGLCFGLTSAIAVTIFYSGGFGGADAKALMCLALALPFHPQQFLGLLPFEVSPTMRFFFPLAVFSNSVLLAALTAIYMLVRNLLWRWRTGKPLFEGEQKNESVGRKILVLITAYKMHIKKLEAKWHLYPMENLEKAEGKIVRKLVAFPRERDRDAIVKRLAEASAAGEIPDHVWATPGLPMLIFITVGLIIALFFGDLVWMLVRLLLG
ncbi:MAG: A24 family peptidase C-terminal domain-containing protein [Nitrososphaerota archaeon]|nr:A24 family peptidase C-terminal domain-containing protein [Nitrososphaerota archaeon]